MAEYLYLLDTNILSDLIKNPAGSVAVKIAAVGESSVCTSIVVAGELRYGAAKKGSAILSAKVDALLAAIDVLSLETKADQHYGEIRNALDKFGTPIGANDLLIAAHALALGLVMVTANTGEFSRVPNLSVENWL